jgi:uncharacterized protein (TIRG00374 family)
MMVLAAAQTSTVRRRALIALRFLASVGVSGFFTWLSLRHTDLRTVLGEMASAPLLPLAGYFLILLVVHLVRTVRWGLLLEPAGRVGFKRLNSASAIGFMLLMVLPLRLGEFARPMLVSRTKDRSGPQLQRSAALASCVVERIVDGLALAAIGIFALRALGASGALADFSRRASVIVGAGFLGLCALLVVAVVARERVVAIARRGASRLPARTADTLLSMLNGFLGALDLGSVPRALAVVLLTAAHWALHVAGFVLVASAFGFHLSPLQGCAVLATQAVGIMVPAGPGMVGTSQFFTQAGLSIFFPGALSQPSVVVRAAAYANCIWMLQFSQQVILGLMFWISGRVSLAGVLLAPRDAPARDVFPARSASY